jgi:hypothetical protein
MLEALSWLGRGALAAKQLDKAEAYAKQTQALATDQLKHRALDAEPHLAIALGAAIEVQALVLAEERDRNLAVAFLREQLALSHDFDPHPNPEKHQSAEPGRQGRASAR